MTHPIRFPPQEPPSFELALSACTSTAFDAASFSFSFEQEVPAHELESSVPLSIFCAQLGMLETLVIYLREVRGLSWTGIASSLKRSPKTIFASYHHARAAYSCALCIDESSARVPLAVFLDRANGPLESIARHLHHAGYAVGVIARLLGRHPQTIYTSLRRSRQKAGGSP